jgi:hypothetical protein
MPYTPGPWSVELVGSLFNVNSPNSDSGSVCKLATEADAKLIAAAPDMAKLLAECEKMMIDMSDRDELDEEDYVLFDDITDLLTQVEGRKPETSLQP